MQTTVHRNWHPESCNSCSSIRTVTKFNQDFANFCEFMPKSWYTVHVPKYFSLLSLRLNTHFGTVGHEFFRILSLGHFLTIAIRSEFSSCRRIFKRLFSDSVILWMSEAQPNWLYGIAFVLHFVFKHFVWKSFKRSQLGKDGVLNISSRILRVSVCPLSPRNFLMLAILTTWFSISSNIFHTTENNFCKYSVFFRILICLFCFESLRQVAWFY